MNPDKKETIRIANEAEATHPNVAYCDEDTFYRQVIDKTDVTLYFPNEPITSFEACGTQPFRYIAI